MGVIHRFCAADNGEFRWQDEHHEDESRGQQRPARRDGETLPDLDRRKPCGHFHDVFGYWIHRHTARK